MTNIKPVPYATQPYADNAFFAEGPGLNGSALVLGWGLVDEANEVMADVLQVGKVTLTSTYDCGNNYGYSPSEIYSTNVCSTFPKGNRVDACSGDSGGPLYVPSSNQLVGITSW